jgi:hypothetical protein
MPISLDGTTGIINPVVFAAGTASTSPAKFTSGTNLTTATAGTIEYDGKKLMFTPQGTQRGVVPGVQIYALNSDFVTTATTSSQPLFNVGVTLSSSTIYRFRSSFFMVKTTVSTAHVVSLSFGGTATINNLSYSFITSFQSVETVQNPDGMYFNVTAASSPITASESGSGRNLTTVIEGTVSVNAGGTFIPNFTTSAAVGPYTVAAGSFFEIWPIGAAGANVSIGAWA